LKLRPAFILSGWIVLLIALFAIGLVSPALAVDSLSFQADDSLAEIREKIELNGYSFSVSDNAVFSLPQDEKNRLFSRRRTAPGMERKALPDPGPLAEHLDLSLPSAFDSRDVGGKAYIGPVRNQAGCGSCYAFGAIAAAEGTYNRATNSYGANAADFSEAFLAFCQGNDYYWHFYGCEGADYEYMELQAIVDQGVITETLYPYSDDDSQTCPFSPYPPMIGFQSWHRIGCQDIDSIKAAIMTYGVVDAAVYVTSAFQAYDSGVYEDDNNGCDAGGYPCYYATTNHAIALVGWDDNPPEGGGGCWILRNSWGENWGEDGYMRIRYDSAAVSCAACYLVYQPMGPKVETGSATGVNETTAQLNGSVNPNGLEAEFYFEYGDTTDFGQSTPKELVATGTANMAVSQALAGLDPATTYYYRIWAGNAEGVSVGAAGSFTTTGNPITPTVEALDAEVEWNSAVLNAAVNAHNSETEYYFEYGPDASYGMVSETAGPLTGTLKTKVSIQIEDLDWGAEYHYRVVASNEIGAAYGADRTFVTPSAPNPPLAQTKAAGPVGAQMAVLNGTVDPNNAEDCDAYFYFEFGLTDEYGSTSDYYAVEDYSAPSDVRAVLFDMDPMTTYHYRMVAGNILTETVGEDRTFTTGQTVYQEDFDHNAFEPDDWTQEVVDGNGAWVYSMGTVGNYWGYSALLCGIEDGDNTRLVTPPLDFSGAVSPTVSVIFDGDLSLYYKANEGDDWTLLPENLDDSPNSSYALVNLPNPSSTYYLAFDGYAYMEECIGLYDVVFGVQSWGADAPIVTTDVVTATTSVSTSVEGEILSQGGSSLTAQGFCYSTSPMPTLADGVLQAESQAGVISGQLTGLTPNTRYHVRAYATNASGTAYGKNIEFRTKALDGPVAQEGAEVYANQFTATWDPVDGATGYYVDLWTYPTPLSAKGTESVRKTLDGSLTMADDQIKAQFLFDEDDLGFSRKDGYVHVFLKGGVLPDQEPGTPGMPAFYANILLPSGASAENLTATASESIVLEDALVYPAQYASSPSLPTPEWTDPDATVYASASAWPQTLASIEGVHSMGGSTFVSLRLNPVRYVPANGEISLASAINVTLDLSAGRKSAAAASPLFTEAVNTMVVNPLEGDSRKNLTAGSTVDYLIITSAALASTFETLEVHRTSVSGMACAVETVEDIEAAYPGLDSQEKIRNCIRDYVENQGTAFVALGGDDTVVPARMCYIAYAYYEEETPADLYYSDLDGDWDANGNGVYGEVDDGLDFAPDVFVGRIPVRNADQASAYINKLIAYETNPEAWGMEKILLMGTQLRTTYWNDDRPSDIIGDGYPEFRNPHHPSVSDSEMWTRRMYRDSIAPNWQPGTLGLAFDTLTTWDAADGGDYDLSPGAMNAAMDRDWTHLYFSGHGNYTLWSAEDHAGYFSDDALALDGLSAFVYTIACMSNGFDSVADPCLSEAFIRNPDGGALTYMGCSRYGWGVSDYAPAENYSPHNNSELFAETYYKRALEPDFISSGEAFALHKADLAPMAVYAGVHRWLQLGINLMGDPAIMQGASYVPGYYRYYVGDATSFTFTGLDSGATYYYQVLAEDGVNPVSISNGVVVTTNAMDISLDNDSVDENLPSGSGVGQFSTTDPESAGHTFTLVSGEGDSGASQFTIDGTTLRTASIFDYEIQDEYSIRVQTNDGSGVYEEVFTIYINNVPEADIALDKNVDDAMPPVGGQAVYTITATNLGPDDASGLEIVDLLPAGLSYAGSAGEGAYDSGSGLWTLPSLAEGAYGSLVITATVTASGIITNTAVLSSTISVEYNSANDQAWAVIDTDTDQDGLGDALESAYCTSPNDRDSDDDGLMDGEEDLNLNGFVDAGETSPCNPDSDNDGVWDGVEAGLTAADVDADTDLAVFKADEDPSTTTDPLNPDSDADGWMDGEEDVNGNGKVDEGEADPLNPATPVATPPVVIQTIPQDQAGTADDQRIATNTCFAVFLKDEDGIDLTDPLSVIFTIDDGVNAVYERNLGDADAVRIVKLTGDPDTAVTSLWAVYNRASEPVLDAVYPYGSTVQISVDAKDRRLDYMDQAAFEFKVESRQQQEDAANSEPESQPVDPSDSALGGDYDAGVETAEAGLAGAKIVYNSNENPAPYFGPSNEIPGLNVDGAERAGAALNLQPPAVFATPVKVFIPYTGEKAITQALIYLYDGAMWVLACDGAGNLATGGEGWMVPGSRVNHPETTPPTIEIQVYHFTGVQTAIMEDAQAPPDTGSDNCFIRALK
jgi:uncharacterized repeat protein (TIGR01451 family)